MGYVGHLLIESCNSHELIAFSVVTNRMSMSASAIYHTFEIGTAGLGDCTDLCRDSYANWLYLNDFMGVDG